MAGYLQVLADVRGNHDAYNIPLRAAPGDHYIKYGRSKELISDRVAVKDVLDSKGVVTVQQGHTTPQLLIPPNQLPSKL